MDETDRPDDRRAAGSWVLPNSESRRQGNHEVAKPGIRKRKKTKTYPRLSCKIEHLLTSNHSDKSIASEFFTGDYFRELHAIWPDRTKAGPLLKKYQLDMAYESVPDLCARFGLT